MDDGRDDAPIHTRIVPNGSRLVKWNQLQERFVPNGSADKTWLAVPVGFALASTSSPVGVEVAASALLPLRRHDFSIENLGVAYESWPVGMLLSMRAVGVWLL